MSLAVFAGFEVNRGKHGVRVGGVGGHRQQDRDSQYTEALRQSQHYSHGHCALAVRFSDWQGRRLHQCGSMLVI